MLNNHHDWTQALTRTSLLGLLLGCALMGNPQSAIGTEPILLSSPEVIKVASNQAGETPKGGGLRGFAERLLDRVKKDKNSPPGQSEPSPPPPTSGSLPGSLTFTGMEGGANPANQTLSITNTGGGTLSWSASESASWLSLSPASGTTTTETDTISVSVNTAGFSANSYSTTITLSATGATNPTQQVPVTLTVTPAAPTIGQSPTSLSFISQEGGAQPAVQGLNITNTGKGTLSWSVSESASWLNINPASGTTTTETDVISVNVNTAGLTTNTYTAPITITDPAASNSPQQVLVTLAITAPASTKATLTWTPNTENDLAGYKAYVGTASRVYGTPIDVGMVTTFEVINLSKGQTYYFAVTAYDTAGNASGYSNEVSKSIP